jgi:hypothetical protein
MLPTSQHPAPTTAFYTTFTRLPGREPGEQRHGYPFKPERLPEAPLGTPPDEELDEPVKHAAEGDDDLMSDDINATDYDDDVPS